MSLVFESRCYTWTYIPSFDHNSPRKVPARHDVELNIFGLASFRIDDYSKECQSSPQLTGHLFDRLFVTMYPGLEGEGANSEDSDVGSYRKMSRIPFKNERPVDTDDEF